MEMLNYEFAQTDKMSVDFTKSGWQQIVDYLIDFNFARAYGLACGNIDLKFAEATLSRCTFGQCTGRTVCREVVLSGRDDIVARSRNFRIVVAWFDCGNNFREIAAVEDIISHIGVCG